MEIEKSLFDSALKNSPPENGDYFNTDGLLVCGKCHTPRRVIRVICGQTKELPVLCACRTEQIRVGKIAEEKQKKAATIQSLKDKSMLDCRFKEASFERALKGSNERATRICKKYSDCFPAMLEKNQGLLLFGPVGTGKTYMAACIANSLMEQLYTVRVTSLVKVIQQARTLRDDDDTFFKKLNRAKLLVIDDFGAERNTEYATEIVYNVIDSRYREKKPMIVTTNLTLSQMQDCPDVRLGRIYDRIFETCYPVEFTGKSLRLKTAAERYDEMKGILEV